MPKTTIFLSHSSHDARFAQLVIAALRDPNLEPWIDKERIVVGDDIFDRLGEGLTTMDLMVFLASLTSLTSEWVRLETKHAIRREIEEKRVILLPFIIDDTPITSIDWYIRGKSIVRILQTEDGARQVALAVRQAIERRNAQPQDRSPAPPSFSRDERVHSIVEGVGVGDWDAAYNAALRVLASTTEDGLNDLFAPLMAYIDYPDPEGEVKWGALLTIEAFAQLAPWLFDRATLLRMATHSDFSVRSSAASICMDFANWAPDLIPTDLMIRLARFDEDWYVMAPATAALKTLCATRPALQMVLLSWLMSDNAGEREHGASSIADIASTEPQILDPGDIASGIEHLKAIGDTLSVQILAQALPAVRNSKRGFRFKYGL